MNKERLQELLAELRQMPGEIDVARRAEAAAKLARDEAREDYDLAVVNALMSANGALDGKNSDERKMKSDAYLAQHQVVRQAKLRLSQADSALLEAQLDRQREEDVFTALRTKARLLAAYLEFVAGAPRNNH